MTAPEQNEEGLDLRTRVQIQAWRDPEFRQLVRTDPRAAVRSLGLEVPDGLDFTVVDDSPGTFHLVVADPPSGESSTVGSEELVAADRGHASEGAHCTLTAECFCPRSLTGACGLFC
ncbi:MAG: nitrile hydratase subunit alpha [Actinobacteria bacterium]|nr:nitrile hydratase subunit alpha [Actinomycetota bacterium]